MKPQREVTGSGFVISNKRILTNAHVIAHQTTVMVRRQGLATKFPAKVHPNYFICEFSFYIFLFCSAFP